MFLPYWHFPRTTHTWPPSHIHSLIVNDRPADMLDEFDGHHHRYALGYFHKSVGHSNRTKYIVAEWLYNVADLHIFARTLNPWGHVCTHICMGVNYIQDLYVHKAFICEIPVGKDFCSILFILNINKTMLKLPIIFHRHSYTYFVNNIELLTQTKMGKMNALYKAQ